MDNIKSIIESLLFVFGEPLSCKEISKIIEFNYSDTKKFLEEMKEEYKRIDRGIELKNYGDSYQFVTKKINYKYVNRLINKNRKQRLSNSAMEILAIIAYKQPITRLEIEEIRGVKSSSSIDTLVSKNLVKEVGRIEKIGKPILYGTTKEFLRVFSLESIQSLPKLKEIELLVEDVEYDEN